MSRVHINLAQGILEVEGEPEFVRGIYDDFKADLNRMQPRVPMEGEKRHLPPRANEDIETIPAEVLKVSETATGEDKPKKARPQAKRQAYTVQKIDTGLPGTTNSIFEYMERYAPASAIETNVVFVKYLKEQHAALPITEDLIYTCYTNANVKKIPTDLHASINDTSRPSKGYNYLDTEDWNDIKLSHKGEVLLHELKQKAAGDGAK